MKKYLTAFLPVDYRSAGKTLLILAVIIFILRSLSPLTSLFSIPDRVFHVGVGLFLVGLYLVFVPAKE